MRFGIRINNADQVKDCSVDVTVGEKTVTIGTANEKYRNIYDKSEDGKTVVYTVVVKGIDAKNFGTNISFVGKANAIDATTQIADTPSTTKNVKNVVTDINAASLDEISLTKDGKLVKQIAALNTSEVPQKVSQSYDSQSSSFYLLGNESTTCELKDDGLRVKGSDGFGIGYKFGASTGKDYTLRFVANTEAGKRIVVDKYGSIKLDDIGDGTDKTFEVTLTPAGYDPYTISQFWGWAEEGYLLKSFTINEVLSDSDIKDNMKLNTDVTLNFTTEMIKTFNATEATFNGCMFNLNEYLPVGFDITKYKSATVKGTAVYASGDNKDTDITGWGSLQISFVNPNWSTIGADTYKYNLNAVGDFATNGIEIPLTTVTKNPDNVIILVQNAAKLPGDAKITINQVTFNLK